MRAENSGLTVNTPIFFSFSGYIFIQHVCWSFNCSLQIIWLYDMQPKVFLSHCRLDFTLILVLFHDVNIVLL